jgi:hypothetical protein
VLASVLGGVVAGSALQRRAAIAVAMLAAATGMLLTVVPMVPETIPVAVTFGLLAILSAARGSAVPAPGARAGALTGRVSGARRPASAQGCRHAATLCHSRARAAAVESPGSPTNERAVAKAVRRGPGLSGASACAHRR